MCVPACVRTCVRMCMSASDSILVQVWRQEVKLMDCSLGATHSVFGDRVLSLELAKQARPPAIKPQGVCLSASSLGTGIIRVHLHVSIFRWAVGLNLRSSCLQGKHFSS